jgi:hypothetical protein
MPEPRILPETEIISLYNKGLSLRDLAKKYHVDKGVIKKRLLKHNVKLRTLSEANRIYSFNENVFNKIDSHEKAYWLGFIAADGNVCNNALKIGLSSKDAEHLEKFKVFLKSDHPIHIYYPKVNGKIYESCEISVHSDRVTADLLKLNITPNKSKTLLPATLKSKYISSYILGIIDGDGCFYLDKKGQMHFSIVGSLSIIQFIMDTLVRECDITATKITEHKNNTGIYLSYFGGNNKIKSIIDFLYKDAYVCLERKFNIVKNHYKI